MAKYTGPDCRLCRREGCKLFLKGEKCYTAKCAMEAGKHSTPPGQHGMGRKKTSSYAIQLREKQKCKRIYGLQEKQFKNYYDNAEKLRGVTGTNMLVLLETRLDNVVYRMGIASSRSQARQFITQGYITVNGAKVDIPSYAVKVEDVIAVKENRREMKLFVELKDTKPIVFKKWLTFDNATLTGKILALPEREDINDLEIKDSIIVELYSK